MNVSFSCVNCNTIIQQKITQDSSAIQCDRCQTNICTIADAVEGTRLVRCAVCPSVELFLRKDFPQRLGVTIVGVGIVASCVAWFNHWIFATFGILFASALLDVVLYTCVGEVLECYRCHAQYRGVSNTDNCGGFDLETHEKYRQEMARLNQ